MINLFDLYKSAKDFKRLGYASKQQVIERIKECGKCEHLTKAFRCTECGCFMKAKVKIKMATCPKGKW